MDTMNSELQQIKLAKHIVIYGAGDMGRALKHCLQDFPFDKEVIAFLVDNKENNPDEVEGLPALDVTTAGKFSNELVLIALHEKHMPGLHDKVRNLGFHDVIDVTFDSDIWSNIRDSYFKTHWDQLGGGISYIHCPQVSEAKSGSLTNINVYVVHSIYDHELRENSVPKIYEVPIQVGAALTDLKICEVKDNLGENISCKNRQYCELTALYWIWKNDKTSKVIGLSHYRRTFSLNENQMMAFETSDTDVMVTVPVLNLRGVREQYSKDHSRNDWDILMKAIHEMSPDYVEAARNVAEGYYYFAYNMLIAKRGFFEDYCAWLFPIMEYCEKRIGRKDDSYQNRYIGFMAERMLTIFLQNNKDKYKFWVADKHFVLDK